MARSGIQLVWGAMLAVAALAFSAVGASAATPPSGSYQSSCWGATAEEGTLRAFCRRGDGSFRLAFLPNYSDCRGDIRNADGRLECSRRGAYLPPGDWMRTCRNYRTEGPWLRAECRNRFGIYIRTEVNYRSCTGDIRNSNGNLVCNTRYDDDLPRGEWIRTCRNYRVESRTLKAECKDERGRYRYTELDLRGCRDRVSNAGGRLYCGSGGDDTSLPPGSWVRSCREGYVEDRTLYAECRNNRGRYDDTSIDLRSCRRQPISNDDGELTCGESDDDDGDGRLPRGSWRDTCRNYRMDGRTLEAECQDRDGGWRYSELDTEDCDGNRVANRNGRLACEDEDGPPRSELIRCESTDNRYKLCPTRDGTRAELERQLSFSPCIRDTSWGTTREGIWVDNGCRAEFRVEDRRR